MSKNDEVKGRLLQELRDIIVPALELAIDGDDGVRINNIISGFMVRIYCETGVWYENIDYYRYCDDNLNGYVSLIIKCINNIFD